MNFQHEKLSTLNFWRCFEYTVSELEKTGHFFQVSFNPLDADDRKWIQAPEYGSC